MKTKKITSILLSLVITALIISFSVMTVIAYSSDEDPLITLSYLTDIVIPKLKNEITDEYKSYISENTSSKDNISDDDSSLLIPDDSDNSNDSNESNESENSDNSGVVDGGNSYTLLELNLGQKVLANSATEIIVRPGSIVSVVSPFDEQGIADITNGVEVLNGREISINSYCIIPRGNDGRGFYVHSDKAYVMIRGEYTIE